jgi:hypothetical protein
VTPDVAHGSEIDQGPAPLTVVEGPWPVRHAPDVAAPDEDDGRYFLPPPAPVPLMKRTLSIRTVILVACAVAAIACGLTYLLYTTTHRSIDSSDESIPVSHVDANPNTDAGADVSYMTPKALREIDAQLGATTSTPAPAPTIDDPGLSDQAPPAPLPQTPDNPVARAPAEATPATMATGVIQKEPQNTSTTSAPERVPEQQAATNSTFPDARDPNALERAIRQYGWKTPAATKPAQ